VIAHLHPALIRGYIPLALMAIDNKDIPSAYRIIIPKKFRSQIN